MKNSYHNLVNQSHTFPVMGFALKDGNLTFHNIDIGELIKKYGTPFRLVYLPKIGAQIEQAKHLFNKAIENLDYRGKYQYAYCTKCNHLYPIVATALKHQVHLETSSSYDIDLIINLLEKGEIDLNRTILHNGYKTNGYLKQILRLKKLGFSNTIVILDSQQELKRLLQLTPTISIGIRMATSQESKSAFHTSRLGIPPTEILDFFRKEIKDNPSITLKMVHFFMDSGIKDNAFYWGEFQQALGLFAQLKKEHQALDSFNIGGGFPIANQLSFNYDYESIIFKMVKRIKNTCAVEKIEEPDIYSEFGKYTVGESSAVIFEVLETKQQNDTEKWYIIDNSLLNTIPDAWAIKERFILLPINKWQQPSERVNIGGISCDHTDYYNSEDMSQEVLLPISKSTDTESLFLGFFHTGAYQDAISGYGGVKHCLVPSPKQIIVELDDQGQLVDRVFKQELNTGDVLKELGYK